jgi:eukaryotic-like serine/threonine-protein kinase
VSKRSLLETIGALSSRRKIADKTVTLKASRSLPKALEPGQRWGQFHIVKQLGHGAFGYVYHARDRLDRDVALKILDGPEAVREGKVLAKLQHPNLVAVHSYEETADGAALSLELIQGQTLEAFATERGRLDPAYASLMCLQVCRALAVVHGKGLVHRDIKAGNVMRQADGRVVLVDFGLGQQIHPDNASGEFAGTLPYMAPELFRGAPASPGTDLYAAGVLLYHLVTLAYPVSAKSASAYREEHAAGRRNHLLDARPDLPEAFIAVVEKATDPDSAKRFRSAGAMALALEQVVQSKPWSSRRFSRIVWSAPVSVVLLAAAFFWLRMRDRSDTPPSLQLTRVTSDDTLSGDPTLSGDGKLLAYASDQAHTGKMDIWVRQMPNGASLRLTHSSFDESNPALSPDGSRIAFRSEMDGGGIYTIPAFGGEPRLLAPRGQDPRFSPDGKYLAYWIGEVHARLPSARSYVMPASGGTPRQLCPRLPDSRYPVWAPDSQHILLQASYSPNLPPDEDAEWWVASPDGSAPVNTGALRRFRAQGLEVHTYAVCWYGDYLVFSAADKANVNLWRTRLELGHLTRPGEARRLTFGTGFETAPWIALNGTLVFQNQQGNLRIWSFAIAGTQSEQSPARVTDTADLDAFPSVSRDQQWLAFTRTSSEAGVRQVWLRNLQSENESMMTDAPARKWNPLLSASGDSIAYGVEEGQGISIYIMDRRTRDNRRLCAGCGFPSAWLPDGNALLSSTDREIQRIDAATGAAATVLSRAGLLLDEAECSPDGKWIAFSARAPGQERNIYVAPYGRPGDWQPVDPRSGWSDKPHWSPDGKSLYFYSNSDSYRCIWSRAFNPASGAMAGPLRAVEHLHNARLSSMSISQPVRTFAVTANRIYLDLAENSASIWMSSLPAK